MKADGRPISAFLVSLLALPNPQGSIIFLAWWAAAAVGMRVWIRGLGD